MNTRTTAAAMRGMNLPPLRAAMRGMTRTRTIKAMLTPMPTLMTM